MRNSPFLASEDIEGLGEVEVVIEGVYKISDAAVQDGRKIDEGYTLKFKGKDKMMVLNATNMKTLSRAFGSSTQNWLDKSVRLFIQDGIRKPGGRSGETTRGLRIKTDAKAQVQKTSDAAAQNMLNKVK